MFNYCPACASKKISFKEERIFVCPDCGFTYYHNTAAATACIIQTNKGILFLVRKREPGRGKLDLPGGFIDPGEGALEGLQREIKEELGIETDIHVTSIEFFASFPNKYPYKNIIYNTCDLFFYMDIPNLSEKDLQLEASEASGFCFIQPEEIDMEAIAFESVKKGIQYYIQLYKQRACGNTDRTD